MKELIQQLYQGIFGSHLTENGKTKKSNHEMIFPVIGFLNSDKRKELENRLHYKIKNIAYFEQALTHRSYLQVIGNENYFSNERLEFLGDAVLGMIVAEYLFSFHKNDLEGELTKMRAKLVNRVSLTKVARAINLEDFVMLSFSADKALKAGNDAILADTLEAIIAAIHLDSGIESARRFIIKVTLPILMDEFILTIDTNYKSKLLEIVQAEGKKAPYYNVIDEKGPDHDKIFTVGAFVDNELVGTGKGKTKKEAEQDSANNALLSSFYSIK